MNYSVMTIRCISKVNLSLLSSNIARKLIYHGSRTIYDVRYLRMPNYERVRHAFMNNFQPVTYHSQLQAIIEKEDGVISSEVLRGFLYTMEKSPTHIDILKKSVERYNSESNKLYTTPFVFGTAVMRTLHHLNEADLAKELFLNPKFDTFFQQYMTLVLLLDLLYENGKYQDVCDIYDVMKAKALNGSANLKSLCNIVILACYKLNTPESLAYGLEINPILGDEKIVRRQAATLSVLALNHNQPQLALDRALSCKRGNYITIRSAKVLALAQLGRIDDLVTSFRDSYRSDRSEKDQYCKDVIPRVEAALEKFDIAENSKIHDLIQYMKLPGFVHELTLDECLQRPITPRIRQPATIRSGDETQWREPGDEDRFSDRPRSQDYGQIYNDLR